MSDLPVLELTPLSSAAPALPPRRPDNDDDLPVLDLKPLTPGPAPVEPDLPLLELTPLVTAPAPAPAVAAEPAALPFSFPSDPMGGGYVAPVAPVAPSLAQTVVPMGDRDLEGQRAAAMADPVSLGERFALNASDAYYGGTLAGSGQLVELQRAAKMTPQEWAEYNAAVRYAGGALKPLPSPSEAQAEILRIAGARARYEAMPWSGGPLEFGAAIGGQLAGGVLTPESGINRVPGVAQTVGAISRAAPAIGRTVEQVVGEGGRAVAGRMLESGLSQGVVNTAIDPLAQVGSIATKMQPGYDPLRTALAAPAGFVLGAGFQGAGEAAGAAARRLLPAPPVPATSPVDLAARGQFAPAPTGLPSATEQVGAPTPAPSLSRFPLPGEVSRVEIAPEQFPPTAAPAPPAGEPYAQTTVPAAPARVLPALEGTPARPEPAAAVPAGTETPGLGPTEAVPTERATVLVAEPPPSQPSPRPPEIGEPVDRPGAAAGRPGEPAPVGEGGPAPVVPGAGEIPGGPRVGADPGERPGDTAAARGAEQPAAQPALPAGEARPEVGAEPPVRAAPEAPAAEAAPVDPFEPVIVSKGNTYAVEHLDQNGRPSRTVFTTSRAEAEAWAEAIRTTGRSSSGRSTPFDPADPEQSRGVQRPTRLTTEPDHTVPGQYVAKNAAGEVVGKDATPEGAIADAQRRSGTPYAEELPAARALEDYRTLNPDISAAEYGRRLVELRDNKPRPINKLWNNPDTAPPDQVEAARQRLRDWNREYRQVNKAHGLALERDNAAFRARQERPAIAEERPAIADQAEAPARLEDQAVVPGPLEDLGTTGPRETLSETGPELSTERPPTPTPPADPTLTKLQATRDALTNKVRTPDEDRRLGRINQQIAKREAALEREAARTRTVEDQVEDRRGGRKQPFTGPPQVGRARDLLDYKFNDGTSVFRSVFEEAGHDPDLAVNFPVKRQVEILTQHMQTKFGFTGVEVAVPRHGTGRVEQHQAVQAMLDMTRAMQDGMASLGLPHEAASFNGRLRLVLEPESKPGPFGTYVSNGTITIRGGANSYGHEWTHGLDHMLAERFTGNPAQMNNLLSRYARHSGLDTSDSVQGAFAKLINTMFYEDVALATRRLALETQAAKVDRQGNPTKGALAAQDQLVLLEGAGSKLRIQSSEFRRESAAFDPPKADYYASVYEMLARAHEAYIARQMQQHGVDPRGIVMPDEAYISMVDRQLQMAYPKQAERTEIFAAFDELHHALRREQVLSNGKPPGDFSNLGISDPHHHRITAPGGGRTTMGQRVKAEINSYKNFTRTLAERAGLFDKDRPKALRPLSTRFADGARAMYKSTRGMMNIIVDRAPAEAKAILQPIMDSLATAPGKGRQTPENFEEAVHRQTRKWNFQYGNILENNGFHEYNRMTTEERQMLRHVLVTGERTMPVDPSLSSAGTVAIPANIVKTAGSVRQLLDQTWRTSHDAGLDTGYARNGYFPRHYDRYRAASDKAGFTRSATELYELMFDQELGAPGSNPQALLEKWTGLPRESKQLAAAKAGSSIDLPASMRELQKNLLRQGEIEENPAPTPAERAELNQLKSDAQLLAADAHSHLRDYIAETNAASWHANLTGGGLADFDTGAPTGKYLQARVLPPEADIIMRKYMEQDPDVAIPAYFHSVARRVAYAERFGAEGQVLKEATEKLARVDGMDGHDTTKFMNLVADITGRNQTNGGMSIFTQIPHNAAFAAGTMVLMERAMWASLHEPIAASMVTGDFRAGLATWGRSVGQLMGTASAKDRTALAEFLGVITSPMHDTTMLSRMGADYSDSPRMQRMLTNFYKTTWLTQVTNGQRAATVGTSNWFLSKLSQNLLDTGTDTAAGHARDNAGRWFRELGLPDSIHRDFARWMVDMNGALPTPEMLSNRPGQAGMGANINVGMGDAYSLAVRRLADRIIQDPKKVDRALLANVPGIGLAFQLMSFNYSFHENVLNPALSRIGHTYVRGREEATARGAGRVSANVQATFGTTGTVVNTMAIAASMVGAALMTGVVRQLLFAPDQLEKHAEEGDLWPYLLRMAVSRSGLYGKYDPLQQTFNHLKYDSDLASMMHGASINWFAKNLQDLFTPLLGTKGSNAAGTNTAEFNQARAAFNLIGVPAAALGLTAMGTFGPVSRILAGAALQAGTSPAAANWVARQFAGHKGATLPTPGAGGRGMPTLPKLGGGMPTLPKLGGSGGAAKPADKGSGFTGLVGDVAIPAIGYIVPQLSTPLKLGAAGAGAAYGVYEANKAVAPFRNLPKPPPKKPARQ
jgi:hypothetical protein